MGSTTWHLSCSFCKYEFYSGRLRPFLHNNLLWATQNSLDTIGLLDIPLLFSSFFLALGAWIFLPAPLQFGLLIGLIFLLISIIVRKDLFAPFKHLFSYFGKIMDSIIGEFSFKVHCKKNDKCPKCKSTGKNVHKTSSCLIM